MNDQSLSARPHDTWASGAAYEPYVGRWSRLVARAFLDWLAVAPGSRWLDVGCGTGALSQIILDVTAPAHVTGIDRSDGYITYAQAHVQDQRARFEVGDAQALPDQPASYDAAISGLMLNFLPQPERAVREMVRVVRPGGIVAAYVWDYAGKMQLCASASTREYPSRSTAPFRWWHARESPAGRYILISYRHDQRTFDEIVAEWRFVDYLAQHAVPVAPALATTMGEQILTLHAPEGVRYAVVTTYVSGQHLRRRTSAVCNSSQNRRLTCCGYGQSPTFFR